MGGRTSIHILNKPKHEVRYSRLHLRPRPLRRLHVLCEQRREIQPVRRAARLRQVIKFGFPRWKKLQKDAEKNCQEEAKSRNTKKKSCLMLS